MKRSAGLSAAIFLIIAGLLGMAITMTLLGRVGGDGAGCPSGLCGGGGLPTSAGEARGIDSMFIEQMIPHHDDAIAMAELALTRAEHPEIKQLAQDVIRTQSAENVQMRGWYEQWYGGSVPTSGTGSYGRMGGGGMMGGGFGNLDSLEGAAQFDKAFIEQMIPHHRMGIMMARMAGNSTSRTEIQGLTESIVRTQSDEITRMQGWYQDWYGR